MSYESFAYLYDELMEDAPYDKWYDFTKNYVNQYHPNAKTILDVGCGTGEMIVRYAKAGFQVTGVDLSSDMLTVAQEKVEQLGLSCQLFEQDMRALEGLPTFDVVTVYCDSLNYLETENDVFLAFQQFHQVLNENGLLLFDVHSEYKMKHIFDHATFAEDLGHLAYIWHTFPGEKENSVEHELTFFVERENGYYERFEENHYQRTLSVQTYKRLLKEAKFEIVNITSDFSNTITEQCERLFFVAKKISC